MVFDILLVLASTIWFYKSLKQILKRKSNSLGDYAIVIIYIFNCFPILLDIIIGKPDYLIYSWYRYFDKAHDNDTVSIIYDIYVILVMSFIKFYLCRRKESSALIEYTTVKSKVFNGKTLIFISILPIIFAIIFGNYNNYLTFQAASSRGLSGIQLEFLMFSELIGLFSYYCWFFEDTKKTKSYFGLIFYSLIIVWIDGKRYLIATVIVLFMYFYLNSIYSIKKKLPLKTIIIVCGLLFGMFYVSYSLTYKINPNFVGNMTEMMYLNFRIDFGRDDVTKFVLFREIVEHSPILDFRFQTILSTLLFFVPRVLWPSKPYPHYRYLTAAIYGVTPLTIPAGMTPSIFEMSIANLGVLLGILVTCFLMVWIIKLADNVDSVPLKSLYLIFIIGLLTQSLDAIIMVLILLPINTFFRRFKVKC